MRYATYFIEAVGLNRIKIGSVAADRMYERVHNRCLYLNVGSPVQLKVICATTRFREKSLHKKFSQFRIKGEWFDGSPDIWRFIDWLSYRPMAAEEQKAN